MIWCNHGPLPEILRPYARPDALLVQARYQPTGWLRRKQVLPLPSLPEKPVLVLAGIAHPERFLATLRQLGIHPVRTMLYPDHHTFTWADLQSIEAWLDDHLVIMTEKDAARLPPELGVYALLMEPVLIQGEAALLQRLEQL